MGMGDGDGFTTVHMYFILLNCTLKNDKFYVMWFYHKKKKVKPIANVSVSKSGHRLGEDICNLLVAKDQYPIILPVYVHIEKLSHMYTGDLYRRAHCKQKSRDKFISSQ